MGVYVSNMTSKYSCTHDIGLPIDIVLTRFLVGSSGRVPYLVVRLSSCPYERE